jgi:tetraacyldisaccharide 4'-kinase
MRDPAFWWRERSAAATLLAPASGLYGAIAAWRMARPGRTAPVPVVCVGNFTVGGAGKTPAAIAIA